MKVLVGRMENITYKIIEFRLKLLHFGVGFNLGFDLNFNINIELYKSTELWMSIQKNQTNSK